jgi:hypothetical protein
LIDPHAEPQIRPQTLTNLLLCAIALLLFAVLLRPTLTSTVQAQSSQAAPLYFEPGVYMLRSPDASRQVFGKVAVDLRTGTVWGFPTTSQDPYPTNAMDSKPPTSRPFVLGRFAVEDTNK